MALGLMFRVRVPLGFASIGKRLYLTSQQEQPEGYEFEGEQGQKLVCKLKKSIYGLKQAGRNWNKTLDAWFKDNNMVVSRVDPCLYTRDAKDGKFLAVAIYVDDIFNIDNDVALRSSLVKNLSKRFKLTDIGETKWILGMKVDQQNGSIHIN